MALERRGFGKGEPPGGFGWRAEERPASIISERLSAIDQEVGAAPSRRSRIRAAVGRVLFNAIPFVLVALFVWIENLIGRQAHNLIGQLALGATVVVEIGLIFLWSLFLD